MNITDFLDGKKGLYIFGCGQYGTQLMQLLQSMDISILGWVVSKCTEESYEGIPVYAYEYWNKNKTAPLIVAVSEKYMAEIKCLITNCNSNEIYYLSPKDFRVLTRIVNPFSPDVFLKSVAPVSRLFGYDRGTPIDRYYIDGFLNSNARKIVNVDRTLEVGESLYTKKYWGKTQNDILSYDLGMDLTKQETLPKERYDVFVCTQVYHVIYDVVAAIRGSYFLLKPGGTLLATVAGNISQVSESDMNNYGYYWGFSYLGIKKLIEEVFGEGNVEVIPYGNSLAATAFIQGIAVEEIEDISLLDVKDESYAICIGIVAKRR